MTKAIKWFVGAWVVLIIIGAIFGRDRTTTPPSESQGDPQVTASQKSAETSVSQPGTAPTTEQPPASTSNSVPENVVDINVVDLSRQYAENEVATDERYKGKVLHVWGTVQAIDKDFTDSIVIKLADKNEFLPAQMGMTDDQKPAAINLKKGDMVTVECKKISRLMDSPNGRGCHLVS